MPHCYSRSSFWASNSLVGKASKRNAMTLEATSLVLLSALLHPIRDLLLKGNTHPESAYLAVTGLWVFIAPAHALATGTALGLPAGVVVFAVLSAAFLTAYYFGTMAALKTGDLSIYYPIIRSSPLLIVLVTWLFAGTEYSAAVLAGITLIVVAGFALQRQPGRLIAQPKTAALAILAMAGSAGYTICDAKAMSVVSPAPFLFWVYVMVTPGFAALALLFKPPERSALVHLTGAWMQTPLRIVAASIVSYLSYLCILVAFGIGAGAAETAAMRQASIPVSVVLAAVVMGETRFLNRLSWSSIIALGIALITLNK